METLKRKFIWNSRLKMCKLERSLYGLKQSLRFWFGRFCNAMKSYKYTQSDLDHTMFVKRRQGKITVLIIYVADMIIIGDDKEEIESLEKKLCKEFEMKNLRGLKYFFGIKVARGKGKFSYHNGNMFLIFLHK
jgi:Reverse transcriptase (RNA-dependent DNA polymerase)